MTEQPQERFRTPLTGHVKLNDFDSVYEPAEDSFLLLDALEKDDTFLQSIKCTDINYDAAVMAQRTGAVNNQIIQPVICNLTDPFQDRLAGKVDVLLFNPPYVVTPSEEVGSKSIEASWAGGVNGREVIDKFLPRVSSLMSPGGVFYLVIIEENDAEDIRRIMRTEGFSMTKVITRRAGRELLSILKFTWSK